ncbi:MAG TPA: thioredoxin domain-containing protein [Myxococcales bacterium]|jgi:protein-disulfide isomerase|nr:thioredoxin domain-containing protein [Myxococcales bacterium]
MRLFLLALLVSAAASAATLDEAKKAAPRADLTGLTDAQATVFLQVAGDVENYAGCQGTLLKCLDAKVKDPHAVRMADLVAHFARLDAPAQVITNFVEKHYASFDPKSRVQLKEECPTLGKGPIAILEFSDYECTHCAKAVPVLDELVTKDRKGKAHLCAKYFPFSNHPRARLASLCAEYARAHGKFWQMHAKIFEHQEQLDDASLKSYAKELGLNGDEMLAQANAGKFDEVVEKSVRMGNIAGVDSTPTLFFDGRMNALPVLPWFLQFSVDDELQWQKEHGWKFAAAPPAKKAAAGRQARK